MALGTDECSAPSALGPLKFSTGIIAGSFSPNPLFARLLPRPNDGKVSVASTRVNGMADCVTVHRGHKLIMRATEVLQHIENFLRFGQFKH